MIRTGIQWCDSTVNPTTGCDGCELWKWIASLRIHAGPCYAGNLHEGRLAKAMPSLYAPHFTEVRLAPGRMAKAAGWSDLAGTSRPDKPWLDGLPRVIFVGDMGDVMSGAVPDEYLFEEVFVPMVEGRGRRHLWMILTKQPRRLADFARWWLDLGMEWPANLLTGVSVTTQATTSRVGDLLRVPGRHFVSAEPLWEAVDLTRVRWRIPDSIGVVEGSVLGHTDGRSFSPRGAAGRGVELVIAGGESEQDGAAHPFDLSWARRLRDDCRAAGVSYFLKQLGAKPFEADPNPLRGRFNCAGEYRLGRSWLDLRDSHGGDESEWPEDLRGCRAFPRSEAPCSPGR